jgi:hypothetical protein
MSDKRISISLDEYNMLHTETLAQKDTITRLTAEVEKLRSALQWQPIETAPKDGTAIDLWSVGGFRYPSAAWDFIPPVNGWGWTDTNHHGSVEEYGPFSHWLLLPPPPALKENNNDQG